MSAVIWCGIVAVWIFVLIPTWVRRGDIHWRRGTAVVTQSATAVASPRSRRRLRVPRPPLLHRSHGRSRAVQSVESVKVEAMAEQHAQSAGEEQVSSAAAPRTRVAAAPRSGRLGGAVRASLSHSPKGSGKRKPAQRVRRARRLVALGTFVLVTLVAAVLAGGMAIAVNLVADVALLGYLRHLRAVARAQQARTSRERRARAARQAWDLASAQDRTSEIEGWRTPVDPATMPYSAADVPTQIDLSTLEQPPLIDLADAPTEELLAAKAS